MRRFYASCRVCVTHDHCRSVRSFVTGSTVEWEKTYDFTQSLVGFGDDRHGGHCWKRTRRYREASRRRWSTVVATYFCRINVMLRFTMVGLWMRYKYMSISLSLCFRILPRRQRNAGVKQMNKLRMDDAVPTKMARTFTFHEFCTSRPPTRSDKRQENYDNNLLIVSGIHSFHLKVH